jgi:hypothetical protein
MRQAHAMAEKTCGDQDEGQSRDRAALFSGFNSGGRGAAAQPPRHPVDSNGRCRQHAGQRWRMKTLRDGKGLQANGRRNRI